MLRDGEEEVFEYNFEGVEGRVRIEPGDYSAVCLDVKKGTSKTNNPKWTWRFMVVGDNAEESDGVVIPIDIALTPATMWKQASVVSALGIAQPGQSGSFKQSDVSGKGCIITVVDNEYNGNISSQISKVKTHPKGTNPDEW